MTDLTNNNSSEGSLIGNLIASLPTATDLIEAATALAVGALLTISLHMML